MKTLVITALAAVVLWTSLAVNVQVPKSYELKRIEPKPTSVIVPCEERAIICRARTRLEKVRTKL